ncbi:MAG TPA: PIN domain-containing protein [Gemmatimonadaceae bacterium]|nr:PIN domain-containing protein [Gemmatimonadaceae bacterium]
MTAPGTPAKLGMLVDTNIILDLVLRREPHARDVALLLDAISKGKARGCIAGHAVTTVYYVVEKERDRKTAITAVGDVLLLLEVVELGEPEFQRALAMGLRDFEDAVQVAACLKVGAEFLVTRNGKDFKNAPVTTKTAGEVLALLAAREVA